MVMMMGFEEINISVNLRKTEKKPCDQSIESIFQIGVFESYPGVPVLSSCKL